MHLFGPQRATWLRAPQPKHLQHEYLRNGIIGFMVLYALKVLLSSFVIVDVTELSKRANSFWAGVLASLPLVSLLAFIWLYIETKDNSKIIGLSWSVFWLVLPSLSLFVALPVLLRRNVAFPLALTLSVVIMVVAYLVIAAILKRFGVSI